MPWKRGLGNVDGHKFQENIKNYLGEKVSYNYYTHVESDFLGD